MADSPLASAFVQATNYTPNGNGSDITRVVIHDMEMPEKGTTAEDCANYFHNQAKDPVGGPYRGSSAHYTCDDNSIVQCVREVDRAWHAPPNAGSIGIEHAGYGSQNPGQWADDYSEAMLRVSARLTADLCTRHKIPIAWLSVQDLLDGHRGITSHNNVSLAWHQSNHTDPGPNFPVSHYIDLVRAVASGHPPQEDDLTPEQAAQLGEVHQILATKHLIGPGKPTPAEVGVEWAAKNTWAAVQALQADVDKLKAGGTVIDYDALATKVADKLATRLKD